jgi:pyruvate,orthophosphate dikinase
VHLRRSSSATATASRRIPRSARLAIDAVFRSYNSHRARYYRQTHGIPDDTGTGVNVQAMVFGNMGERSGTGVCFTRDPKSGGARPVRRVAARRPGRGRRRGHPHAQCPINRARPAGLPLERRCPRPTRSSTRDEARPRAALPRHAGHRVHHRVRPAVPAADPHRQAHGARGGADRRRPRQRGADRQARGAQAYQPEGAGASASAGDQPRRQARRSSPSGLDASPGAACGRVVFTRPSARSWFERDEQVILVRLETSPEDIQGMTVAQGILTARGGQTSHAAVVARGMGKPCVVGCTEHRRRLQPRALLRRRHGRAKGRLDHHRRRHGRGDGGQGRDARAPRPTRRDGQLLGWADGVARLKVRANADTGVDAAKARQLGATGIGLCRTEHMFFQPDALRAMRKMILADDPRSRLRALKPDPADPAHDVQGDLRGDGRPAGHHPPARPAAARVLAAGPRRPLDVAQDLGVSPKLLQERLEPAARGQPDARAPRRARRHHQPGGLPDPGARDLRGGGELAREGRW